jgi:peroxidase
MALTFRSIDGFNNNLDDPALNSTGSDMVRIGEAHFNPDGSPIETVNPREVSNNVVGQGNADVANPEGLSGMMYAWGQFLDHDLDLVASDGVNHIDIPIPPGDPNFPPGSSIPLTRSVVDPANGLTINQITGWLDGSMVYGSTQAVADSLRLPDGHLKTSDGNNLPINPDGTFAAGDVRAQENPSLTALQTLFVREHNYQVDRLADLHPNWSGDRLYQEARAIVGGEIANITYNEFLPHLLGPAAPGPYPGYNPDVNPTISEEFAAAAYRFGHSIVSDDTVRVDNNGVISGPELALKDAFFLPANQFTDFGGADGFLRHLASEDSQALDARIVDSLRNFLFDPPAGQDLAAINIQRGHDQGIGTLNETRVALGLEPYKSFEDLTSDQGTLAALKQTFTGGIDQVDLWTGGLAENHMPGAMVGQTFGTIIADQFAALRNGDRFYFENALPKKEVAAIKATTLSDIIERDTDTNIMQADAFLTTERHASDVAPELPNAPQLIIGIDGFAKLDGGDKGDTLVAGNGFNLMTGGEGADVFDVSATGASQTLITDFQSGVDKIQIGDLPGKNDTVRDLDIISTKGGNTVIDAGNDLLVLQGVGNVARSDFVFTGNQTAISTSEANQLVQAMASFGAPAVETSAHSLPEPQPQLNLTLPQHA